MRIELFQMCCYVSYIRHFLELNKDINFNDYIQYIDSIIFKFLSRKKFFHKYEIIAHNFHEWTKY